MSDGGGGDLYAWEGGLFGFGLLFLLSLFYQTLFLLETNVLFEKFVHELLHDGVGGGLDRAQGILFF